MPRKVMAFTVVSLAVLATSATPARTTSQAACEAAAVHYTPPPLNGFQQMPWVRDAPTSQNLVGLLWYWPAEWKDGHVGQAQMYSGGHTPDGRKNMKILWTFLAPSAKRALDAQTLVVKAHRLDGAGRTWQRFTAISYSGQNRAPSFASVINLPAPGCWRLELTAGSLHGTATFRALSTTQ